MSIQHLKKRQSMIATLAQKTGKPLDEWIRVVEGGPATAFMERVRWLKQTYGLGHFQARLIVTEARDRQSANTGNEAGSGE